MVRFNWTVLLLGLSVGVACAIAATRIVPPLPVKPIESPEAKRAEAEYQTKYTAYRQQRDAYEKKAAAYWDLVESKRADRRKKRAGGNAVELADYVLDQPPVYAGPSAPVRPPILRKAPAAKTAPVKVEPLPVVADFLRHAKMRFRFMPKTPATEMDYKRAYARTALAAGISKEQAVRIYGFEAGGNGGYDVQAGLEAKRPNAKPISTAIGYNQLLIPNTIGILAEHGAEMADQLDAKATAAKPDRRKNELQRKAATLRRMVRYARALPFRWSAHVKAAETPRGSAVHALNLDVDIGPMLQTHKLLDSLKFLHVKGYDRPVSAAELEMMNLMGDGSGFEVVTMPVAIRDKVPTANFFQRGGYERNPVAGRNNVVSALLAAMEKRMEQQATLDGAKQLDAAFQEALQTTE
jgi:hypothetical protein